MLAPDKNGESERIQKLYSVQKLLSENLNKKTLLSQFRSYHFRIWNFMTSDNFYKWKKAKVSLCTAVPLLAKFLKGFNVVY